VSIDRFLQGASLSASRTGEGSLQSCLYTNMDDVALRQAPEVLAEGFSLPEAEQEAGRCLQCQCLECVKACTYLESFGGYPKKYVREIYNNLSIVMGVRQSNTLTNSCSLCGLCAEVCPNDLNMADVCRDARRTMVSQKRMPPSAHDFALRDMAFANSDACALAQGAAGSTTCRYLFFPGCQLAASAPAHVEKTYRLLQDKLVGKVGVMLRCCGAPADWAGRDDLLQETLAEFKALHHGLGSPRVIFACPSCSRVFKRLLPGLDTVSLWEIIDTDGIAAAKPVSAGMAVCVHDPCSARYDDAVQESARSIAARLGCSLEELPLSRRMTACCSFGGLQWFANTKLARASIERRMRESDRDYLTYCSMCRDLFASQGKRCLHMLDLVFENDIPGRAARACPTWSQRRDNRALLKRTLCAEQKEEAMADLERGPELIIPAGVQNVLDDRFILTHDIARVIGHAETTGRKLVQPGTGRSLAYCKIGSVTYWVEYAGAQGGPYTIYNAYSHRMEIRERTDA
jgi:glutamate synthase (NADPH) small chain